MIFENGQDAGKRLAAELIAYKDKNLLVLALPRGGVPVGYEIATLLHAPLDVLVVRKIGAPSQPELGIGALAEGNVRVLDKPLIQVLGLTKYEVTQATQKEKKELQDRIMLYRDNKPLPMVKKRSVLLVDDGLATGISACAAITSLRRKKPEQIIFAAPVCAYDATQEIKDLVDHVFCVIMPVDFEAVGLWYRNFSQVSDEEVRVLLGKNRIR